MHNILSDNLAKINFRNNEIIIKKEDFEKVVKRYFEDVEPFEEEFIEDIKREGLLKEYRENEYVLFADRVFKTLVPDLENILLFLKNALSGTSGSVVIESDEESMVGFMYYINAVKEVAFKKREGMPVSYEITIDVNEVKKAINELYPFLKHRN
ncbi:hypothetical protein [Thermococcus paralvinellae]|uniref:hypothetical protein n=1 Tax=Thermococcus paralvinellae TaxID=582419 RepID=UPI0005B27620|nr:hypothetical protein [Thermococcus paralvinellae]